MDLSTHLETLFPVATKPTKPDDYPFEALGDYILVTPIDQEERKVGEIILPVDGYDYFPEARVVAVGRGSIATDGSIVPHEVAVGDIIIHDTGLRALPFQKDGKQELMLWLSRSQIKGRRRK